MLYGPLRFVLTSLSKYSSVVSVMARAVGFTPAQLKTKSTLPSCVKVCRMAASQRALDPTSHWKWVCFPVVDSSFTTCDTASSLMSHNDREPPSPASFRAVARLSRSGQCSAHYAKEQFLPYATCSTRDEDCLVRESAWHDSIGFPARLDVKSIWLRSQHLYASLKAGIWICS